MSSSVSSRDLVFISYSHANPTWRDRLLVLLKPFVRQGRLQVWADPYIAAGSLWRREIDAALARTRVGVVLLTPDLLASDFVAGVELPLLLRAAQGGALTLLVIPIERHVAGSTLFPDGDLADYQCAGDPVEPLDELPQDRRNRALVTVSEAIIRAAGGAAPAADAASAAERTASAVPERGTRLGALHGVPSLPPHHLARNDAHESLKYALLGTSQIVGVSASESRVGLHGEGGLGKTVVAQGVVIDEDVRRAFRDGIYWITLGQQPKIEALQAWLADLFGPRAAVEDVGAGVRLLRERLQGRACLVVLDDVWQLPHARAFDVLDDTGRLLVTTRDRTILTALGSRDLRLDRLPPELALTLLARWAGVPLSTLPNEANLIAKEVAYLPLALSLAGAQVREGASWADVLAALRQGDSVFLDHPYGSVFKSIQASVNALEPADAERYLELAVFPEDVEVPVAVVEELWRATSGCEPSRLRALLTRLAARNLVRLGQAALVGERNLGGSGVEAEPVVSLHDLQHDFVRLLAKDVAALHGQLVDAWHGTLLPASHGDVPGADGWASLPLVPTYRWHFLAYHLRGAGRDAVGALLTSPDWLYARLTRFSLQSLLTDYEGPHLSSAVRSVRDALVLSAHVLARDPAALSEQLAGRLWNSPETAVQSLIARRPSALRDRARLRPLMACLTPAGGPLLRTFEGHTYPVTALAVLPNGQRALSASDDRTLKLWDLTTGTVLQTFEGHTRSVTAAAVLRDGHRALSASADRTLKLWDVTTATVLQTFEGQTDCVSAVVVLPDGQRALSGSFQELKLWDLRTGTVLQTFEGQTDWVTALAALPDGQRALSASADSTVKLWDLTTGSVLQTFHGHTDRVTALAVLPDGQRALSASDDRTLKLWDLTTGTVLHTLKEHTLRVTALAVLPDGQRALSASADCAVKLWDLTTGSVLQTFYGHTEGVTAVAVLPDGQRALSASDDDTLKLWDLGTGTFLDPLKDHIHWLSAVVVLPDGQRALSASHEGLRLWDLSTGSVLQNFEGQTERVTALAILPNGQRALSASYEAFQLLDLSTGSSLQNFEGHTRRVTALALFPDGRRALSASADRTLKLWDLTTGTVLQTFVGHTKPVTAVAVLPDEQRALSASDDGTLRLWDIRTGSVIRSFEGMQPVKALAVLPDRNRAIAASAAGTLNLWDLTTGTVVQTLEGHTGFVPALAVLPHGQQAISGSHDRTVILWDLASGAVICKFYDDAPITGVAAIPRELGVLVWNQLGRVYRLNVE